MKTQTIPASTDSSHTHRTHRLLTPRQVWETYPVFTQGSFRWLLFHRQANGLHSAVRKIGRKLLIDEEGLLQWIDAHAEVPK